MEISRGTLDSFDTSPSDIRHGPIVVDGNTNTVRSAGGTSGFSVVPGAEYDFDGNVQGPLTFDFTAHAGRGRIVDAAFDGANSYVVSGLSGVNSGIYRYNADFSGPGTLLFTLPETVNAQGITYDTTTDTFWVSDYDFGATLTGGKVRQYSLDGDELFSFNVVNDTGVASERNTALAYDFSDDTFWMNAHVESTLGFGRGELWQFDRNGNFLDSIHARQFDASAPNDILYWGGEIRATGAPTPNPVPVPASLGLFALGLACLVSFMRRGRRLMA